MPVDDIRKYIEGRDFQALEEVWLARLEEPWEDLAFFLGTARLLKGAGEAERGRVLLALVDEECVAARRWELRLALLRRAGDLLHAPAELHEAILETVRRLHGGAPSLEALIDHVGLHRAVEATDRTWEKVERLRALLAFDLGAVVWMKDKGAGRVVEVNCELESLKIDFERQAGLRVAFKAAPKLLRALPPGDFLRRRLETPEELSSLPPQDLLEALLAGRGALSAAEIRAAVEGLVAPGGWSAWWSAAKRSPRVVAEGSGAHQRYRKVSADADAADSVLRAFAAASPAGKVEILRREADRDPALRAAMAAEVEAFATQAGEDDLESACAAWYAVAEVTGRPPAGPASPAARVRASADPAAAASRCGERGLRERLYRLIREERLDAAARLVDALRLESDPRLLDLLGAWVAELAPAELERFLDEVRAQPRRRPAAFVWLLETGAARPEVLGRAPLRLLQQVFAALRQEELKPFRARLRRLCTEGPLLPVLLAAVEEGQAEAALQALDRAPLEEYLRTPLREALVTRLPALRPAAAAAIYALPSSIAARRRELREIREQEIPANRRALQEAREHGDLRENFEYKTARQRHEYLSARAAALERDLTRVEAIDLGRAEHTEVRIAVRVHLASDGDRRTVSILGPWESDPERDIVSYDSDLGRSLLGKAPGEEAEFAGRRWRILAIEPLREGEA